MHKRIEYIHVTDPQTMKESLEKMVNDGWELKGFVCFNSGNTYNESFAVLEQITEKETANIQEPEIEKPAASPSPYNPPQEKKEISISVGGN